MSTSVERWKGGWEPFNERWVWSLKVSQTFPLLYFHLSTFFIKRHDGPLMILSSWGTHHFPNIRPKVTSRVCNPHFNAILPSYRDFIECSPCRLWAHCSRWWTSGRTSDVPVESFSLLGRQLVWGKSARWSHVPFLLWHESDEMRQLAFSNIFSQFFLMLVFDCFFFLS